MKKYLLTALLWVIGLFGFTNANTVWNLTSDSEICSIPFTNGYIWVDNLQCGEWVDTLYACVSSSAVPFSVSVFYDDFDVLTSPTCSSEPVYPDDADFNVYDIEWNSHLSVAWTLYLSHSPITIVESSWWWNSSWWSSSSLISWWTAQFSWIITSLWNAVSEFIPYVAYIGIGLLGAIIWFVAIKRLINWVRAKIYWTFSWWRRR